MVAFRRYCIVILLLVSLSVLGQKIPIGTIASSIESTTTGKSVLLYYEDFDNRAADGSLTEAEMEAIFGPTSNASGGDGVFNVNGDAKEKIFDDGGGDMVLLSYFDYPHTGSDGGFQVWKSLRERDGADASLDGHSDLWVSCNAYWETPFNETASGKITFTLRTGDWIWDYDVCVDTWPELEMGENATMTYNNSGFLKTQVYWYNMDFCSGESFNWDASYQGAGGTPISGVIANYAMHVHMPQNPPDSVDGYIEMYVNEILVARYDTFSLRMSDTLTFGWLGIRWQPSESVATVNDYWQVIDNIALWYNTPGDSTWTGMEWLAYPDSALQIDAPGWPIGEDTTGWGTFEQPVALLNENDNDIFYQHPIAENKTDTTGEDIIYYLRELLAYNKPSEWESPWKKKN
jgi:hypothetical protein